LERAETRIRSAILGYNEEAFSSSPDIDISSFPIAMLMVAASGNVHLKRRFALAEAKRVAAILSQENPEKIASIARSFKWNIEPTELEKGAVHFDFTLSFLDYLRNASTIQAEKWKLTNRLMLKGEVYITGKDASRLLQEEVRRHIESRLSQEVGTAPSSVTERVEKLTQLFVDIRGRMQSEEMPKQIVSDAFPPCIRELRKNAKEGRHLSHIGRFALTSFLINIGMPLEDVVDCFRSASDFNERMTRYQAEHIGGGRGSRTKYVPPKCETLRTHGVCPGMDTECRTIRHPLKYYQKKHPIMGKPVETKVENQT
jgi:DNA primase large subunit